MKTKQQKKEELKKIEAELPQSKITVFTTFARAGEKGLSVSQVQELKRVMRAVGSEYTTAKKTLLEIALRDLKYDGVDVYSMSGSMGLVLGKEDPFAVAKKLHEFAKKNQALQFFGALLDGKFISREEFVQMALLPSREVLLARLFGMMKYPLSGLAMVLSQIAKQKEGTVATN